MGGAAAGMGNSQVEAHHRKRFEVKRDAPAAVEAGLSGRSMAASGLLTQLRAADGSGVKQGARGAGGNADEAGESVAWPGEIVWAATAGVRCEMFPAARGSRDSRVAARNVCGALVVPAELQEQPHLYDCMVEHVSETKYREATNSVRQIKGVRHYAGRQQAAAQAVSQLRVSSARSVWR